MERLRPLIVSDLAIGHCGPSVERPDPQLVRSGLENQMLLLTQQMLLTSRF
jgi:hypothetical protein